MPQFHIDLGCDYERFNARDEFTRGYIEAIFWLVDEEIENPTFAEFSEEALAKADSDCAAFQSCQRKELAKAYDQTKDYDANRAGVDFWLTRNGHGAGFWDRGLGKIGDVLTEAARAFGQCDMYQGDDEKLYLQ